MAYNPSRERPTDGEPFTSMNRLAQEGEGKRALANADIVGCSEDEARRRVEAAGLDFRAVRAGELRTADFALTRVTATIVDGRVHDASIG